MFSSNFDGRPFNRLLGNPNFTRRRQEIFVRKLSVILSLNSAPQDGIHFFSTIVTLGHGNWVGWIVKPATGCGKSIISAGSVSGHEDPRKYGEGIWGGGRSVRKSNRLGGEGFSGGGWIFPCVT